VLEEKLVKRKVSLKSLDYQKVEEARRHRPPAGRTWWPASPPRRPRPQQVHQGLGLKGVQSQVQGEQLRVTGKKRDDLQATIAALSDEDFGIPLQFNNFRD
jgi:uncharacterized protein YajQ (UPF0234 family)